MFYSGGAWGQTDADILAWKFLVMTLRGGVDVSRRYALSTQLYMHLVIIFKAI